ncbi:T9SS type A sorting domain-containing protein [Wenyingzhuangia aestuarii]|uniref:T9SS type A sorting domain-containing protein n=1 Tax=Wenyingzhuangia aestuarii TaxID=1647582 RepID=UPI00143C7B5A|nr:T9SS type A sorting domain-containing protein [Wenyingzhuangia aestuarii]NJB83565.1 hypothetical protein [Wenyingzhuangia aestuarii]
MKKQLLKISAVLLFAFGAKAQITNFNANAFSFEPISVEWTSNGTHNGASSPGNIVDAWTQVDGFEQSNGQARTGTYSMLADFSTTIPVATPKLQTWRSNTNKEGNFNFDSDAGSDVNYTIMGYVYVDVVTDGTFKINIQKNGGQFEQATINLNSVTPGTWTLFSKSFDFTEGDGADYWCSVNFATLPTINAKIYLDDVSVVQTTTLSTSLSKIDGASVKAENGSINVTGANLDAVYSITGQQVATSGLASGVYIVKISKNGKQDAIKVVL